MVETQFSDPIGSRGGMRRHLGPTAAIERAQVSRQSFCFDCRSIALEGTEVIRTPLLHCCESSYRKIGNTVVALFNSEFASLCFLTLFPRLRFAWLDY